MRVSLFVPCYVDQLAPEAAWATVELLERLGCRVDYDPAQACCGQALLTAGDREGARQLAGRFAHCFAGAEHVVAPSASCVATVRHQYAALLPEAAGGLPPVRELCEFVVGELGVEALDGRFPHRVGLHPSCHGLRGLRLGTGSERAVEHPDPARRLLASLAGIELVDPARPDECCGFGGVFAVREPEVSASMGRDRLRAHAEAGAELLTATDLSCLLHLGGVAGRQAPALPVRHVAEILAEATRSPA